MGNLPTNIYAHRVMFLGDDAIVAGGWWAASQDNLRTFKITRGQKTPVELGNLGTRSHAENASQGMAWVDKIGQLCTTGDCQSGIARYRNKYNPGTGTWDLSAQWSANNALSGVTLTPGATWNNMFSSSGDAYSVSQFGCIQTNGTYSVLPLSGSPIGMTRPFAYLAINSGEDDYTWWPAPLTNSIRMLRIDTRAASGGFQTFSGLFDATYSTANAATCKMTKGANAGKWFICGGHESSVPASNKAWILDISNAGAPTTVQRASMSTTRHRHTCHELPDGRIVVIGGANTAGNTLSTTEIYDPASNTWTAGPAIPAGGTARHSSAVSPRGNILLVGGFSGTLASPVPKNNVDYLYKDGSKWIKADW